ncbi:MAG: rod shape-determining protein MreC [Oscillospiraceae bacterium]|nr:rod shape-determining protein MreC [Oscillospiraceae bacterium]
MSFFKNKVVVAIGIIIAAVLTAAGIMQITGGKNYLTNALMVVISPAQSAASWVSSSIDKLSVSIWEMHSYKEENERLVNEVNELKRESRGMEEYKAENDRLRELLDIKNVQMSEYNTVAARIISYEPDNRNETIVIDKGTHHGIKEGSVVVTGGGVVGQVTEAGTTWSRISAIINLDNAVGVRVIRTGEPAIVEGDPEYSRSGNCIMTFIGKDASVIVGDLLETSGLGGIYPPGMPVGTVIKVNSDSAGTMQYAVVEPVVDFNNLYEVLVICDGDR